MKYALVVALGALLLAGCETRSISNSGYRSDSYWGRGDRNPFYTGELTELDILGIAPNGEATNENIAQTLATATTPKLKRGDRVLLMQSGAMVPDEAMLTEANRYFEVAPFSGVPPSDRFGATPAERTGFAPSLRLRAAQGGYRIIVCYWGVLESAREGGQAGPAGWVPIVSSLVPDQKQQMRIRLKAIVVDVASGAWRMLAPEVYTDESFNSYWSRERKDQLLVNALKEKGYKSLVADLLK